MSLVNYADSSDSDDEICKAGTSKPSVSSTTNLGARNDPTSIFTTDIFTDLPQPVKADKYVPEERDEFLKKKELQIDGPSKSKQPVKISIPSLSYFDSDEDEPAKKKQKSLVKSSGLFDVLPRPKSILHHKQFIPNIIRNKNKMNKPDNKPKKLTHTQSKSDSKQSDGSDSDDDQIPSFDEDTWLKICGRQKRFVGSIDQQVTTSKIDLAPEPVTPYQGLDNEAFQELLGTNSKKKIDDIDVVEINEDEILPDKEVWMSKSLTDPELAPKFVVKEPVNDTCRRKHHITYLAQQAKANEQDLKNQWAQNKFTRQKTQAKYGF